MRLGAKGEGEKKGKRERERKARQTDRELRNGRSAQQIQAFQLKSADMSDVSGHGILNISGRVSGGQHKAINFFGIFSTLPR